MSNLLRDLEWAAKNPPPEHAERKLIVYKRQARTILKWRDSSRSFRHTLQALIDDEWCGLGESDRGVIREILDQHK